MGSLHPCMVEKETSSPRTHSETVTMGRVKPPTLNSIFHVMAGEKEHVRPGFTYINQKLQACFVPARWKCTLGLAVR